MDGDGEEEGVKLRVMAVSNQGIKGWWIRLPSFPEVACVGDTVARPSGPQVPRTGQDWRVVVLVLEGF